MARGGYRPGAGRPSAASVEEKKSLPARMMAKCQEKLQRNLPDLIDRYLALALEGDKEALKWCIERGMGKAAVAQQNQVDTEIKVVLGNIPRPGKANDAQQVGAGVDEGEAALRVEDGEPALEEGAEEEEEAVMDAEASG